MIYPIFQVFLINQYPRTFEIFATGAMYKTWCNVGDPAPTYTQFLFSVFSMKN